MQNAEIVHRQVSSGSPTDTGSTPDHSSWLGTTIMALAVAWLIAPTLNLAGPISDQPSSILAVVNEDTIRSDDIDELLVGAHSQMGATGMRQFDFRKLFDKLINDKLLIREARQMELHLEPWLVEEVRQVRIGNAVALFANEQYKPELVVDSAEIDAYFHKYYSRLQLRSVSVPLLADARAVAAAVRNGADMDSLARERSVDVHKPNGGLHNFKYYGDVETDLREQADQLTLHAVSDPFPYRQVYSVIRVEQTAAPDRADLPGLKTKITNVLRYDKNLAARTAFLDSLNRLAPVTVDAAVLENIRKDSLALFTPAFMSGSKEPVLSTSAAQVVTDDQLRKAISHEAMSQRTDPFDSLFARAWDKTRERMMLQNGARLYGYLEDPRVEKIAHRYLDSSLIEVYIQQTVVPLIQIDPVEVEAYYESHLDDFRNPSRHQFERMMFTEEEPATRAVQRLQQGGNFKFVANQLGGLLSDAKENAEWLSLSGFPARIRKQIASLQRGEVTSPLATAEGWLILKIKARKPGAPRPLEEVVTEVKSIFFAEQFTKVMDQTLGLLKDHSQLWIDTTAVDEYFGAESSDNNNDN